MFLKGITGDEQVVNIGNREGKTTQNFTDEFVGTFEQHSLTQKAACKFEQTKPKGVVMTVGECLTNNSQFKHVVEFLASNVETFWCQK